MSANAPVEDLFSFSTALEMLKQGSGVKRNSAESTLEIRKFGRHTRIISISADDVCAYDPTQEDLLANDWQETTPILD